MKRSLFQRFRNVSALILMEMIGSLCMAGPLISNPPKMKSSFEVSVFDQRLAKVLSDKSGLKLKSSTEAATKGRLKDEMLKNAGRLESPKQGGVSDGGGNAVGKTLFDFYENKGSVELSLDELVALEPGVQVALEALNRLVPAVGTLSSGGLRNLLVKSISAKTLYLESKKISSEACVNQSIFANKAQVVVACQSDLEIRFNVQWLRGADSKNRAGLIMHEMFLAWARDLNLQEPKESLEKKVRIMNDRLFKGDVSSKTYATDLAKYFRVRTFNADAFTRMNEIAKRIEKLESFHPELSRNVYFAGLKNGNLRFSECQEYHDFYIRKLPPAVYQSLQQEQLSEVRQLCIEE